MTYFPKAPDRQNWNEWFESLLKFDHLFFQFRPDISGSNWKKKKNHSSLLACCSKPRQKKLNHLFWTQAWCFSSYWWSTITVETETGNKRLWAPLARTRHFLTEEAATQCGFRHRAEAKQVLLNYGPGATRGPLSPLIRPAELEEMRSRVSQSESCWISSFCSAFFNKELNTPGLRLQWTFKQPHAPTPYLPAPNMFEPTATPPVRVFAPSSQMGCIRWPWLVFLSMNTVLQKHKLKCFTGLGGKKHRGLQDNWPPPAPPPPKKKNLFPLNVFLP